MRFHHLSSMVALAAMVLLAGLARGERPDWRYVVHSATAPQGVVFRAVHLSSQAPADLQQRVAYRGQRQSYGQVRYGTDGSVRVTIVVDRISRGEADVYLDANRDRVIDDQDRVAGTGKLRHAELEVEIAEDVVSEFRSRQVWLRISLLSDRIYLATDGYAEGMVTIDGMLIHARRLDANANGLFADVEDRLWLDLNQDGQWSPVTEQYAFLPIMRIRDGRYAVRADRLGESLRLEPVIGEGQIQLQLSKLAAGSQVLKLQVMLLGDDGSAFSISGTEEAVTAPVGKYSIGAVTALIEDDAGNPPWHFVFSRPGADDPAIWYDVGRDQKVTIDPLASFRFELELPDGDRASPGRVVSIRPRLYTRDGLLINASSCGEPKDSYSTRNHQNVATLSFRQAPDRTLQKLTSGFA